MRFHSFPFTALAVVFFSILLSIEANDGGFTVDLIHRDSPKSPFYNPSQTPFERTNDAFRRSLKRKDFFASTGLIPSGGEYLMEISFGTPPFKTLAIVDTGSGVTWTQCQPCITCFKQEFPIFDPKNSSSFKLVPCKTKTCKTFQGVCASKTRKHANCLYEEVYAGSSTSVGDLATETITFGSKNGEASFPNFVFGCGRNNFGPFPNKTSGIVGLGFGKESIISQLNSSIDGKFAYCLGPSVNESKSGQLSFGKQSVVTGRGVVSTPLIMEMYYYVILEGLSVGNKRLDFTTTSPPKPLKDTRIVIDSGTTLTYLPIGLYNELISTVKGQIKSGKIVPDPLKFFGLCYSSLDDADIPIITVHFKGADVQLKPLNTFTNTSPSSKCLAFTFNFFTPPIYGNIAQKNFWVGYDLKKKIVSFKPIDCTKL